MPGGRGQGRGFPDVSGGWLRQRRSVTQGRLRLAFLARPAAGVSWERSEPAAAHEEVQGSRGLKRPQPPHHRALW